MGVYPPLGRVSVAGPLVIDDEAVRLAVIGKFPSICVSEARNRIGGCSA